MTIVPSLRAVEPLGDVAVSDTRQTTPDTCALPPAGGLTPFVRYAYSTDEGPRQRPILHRADADIPDDAYAVSAIYLLTGKQIERQQNLENPHAVTGSNPIAKELQDECEARDRVLYPVHVESDQYHKEDPATLVEWIQGLAERLGIDDSEWTYYFSGNRSIHAHAPLFVTSEADRKKLKQLADEYCEETTAVLDTGIYNQKQPFRIPGVQHAKSSLYKASIERDSSHEQIIKAARHGDTPASYQSVISTILPPTTLSPPYVARNGRRSRDREITTAKQYLNEIGLSECILALDNGPTVDSHPVDKETATNGHRREWAAHDTDVSSHPMRTRKGGVEVLLWYM